MLRPLLEVIREADVTYYWGHPFYLIVRKQGTEFYMRSPDQLPALFSFLDKPVVAVPNCFDFLLCPEAFNWSLPRPQRPRRNRSRGSSREPCRSTPATSED